VKERERERVCDKAWRRGGMRYGEKKSHDRKPCGYPMLDNII